MTIEEKDPLRFYVYMWLREKDSKTALAGTPYYIGKGNGKRATDGRRKGIPKNKENIVIVESNLSEEAAFALEIELIKKYGRKDIKTGILINLSDGGEGQSGYRHTEETKARIGKSGTGLKRSDQFREDVRARVTGENNPMFGKTFTEEEIHKMSLAMMGENNPFYGRTHSDESIRKMSDAKRGKKQTPEHIAAVKETRKKNSEANPDKRSPLYGRSQTEETKAKISLATSGENNPMYGRTHSEESIKKMSEAKTGKTLTKEHIEASRLANTGKKRKRIECPHCHLIGAVNMHRYHFDNCKLKS